MPCVLGGEKHGALACKVFYGGPLREVAQWGEGVEQGFGT